MSPAPSVPHDHDGLRLGAVARDDGTHFALWTSRGRECAVRLHLPGGQIETHQLAPVGDGVFATHLPGVGHGALYDFTLNGKPVRDAFARWLPNGVNGPAMVWRRTYAWQHAPVARPLSELVIYELHVGTFTLEGTYPAAASQLPALVHLGITAIELMPLGAFPGSRGWGYDGVAHFAPFAPYGTPDELCAFIDAAHGLGLTVLLDVVYNHFGPAGNVLHAYGAEYFTSNDCTPWGEAPDFAQTPMRRYVLRNVRYWLEEFRFDGLRFDATHAITDPSQRHILREVADEVATLKPKRWLIADDDRNDPRLILDNGFDAVWADDFHHQVHVALTGERNGYYAAYTGTAADLAETINNGWFYRGAIYSPTGKPRGSDATALPAEAFIYCLQNHDQIGTRAFGDRLTQTVSLEAFGAATMLLLFLPMTPLLFMGQETAAPSPFLYFTDHEPELGVKITEGRRRDFARFLAFADERTHDAIPDPQAISTYEASRLTRAEHHASAGVRLRALHHAMLTLRASDPVMREARRDQLRASARGQSLIVERWLGPASRRLIINLGVDPVDLRQADLATPAPQVLVLSTGGISPEATLPRFAAVLLFHPTAPR